MAEIWAWLEDRLSKRMAAASHWRTPGSLRMEASTRALTSPVWPQQAPQSSPAATTVNTAADWDLSVTLQAGNAANGDTITLDSAIAVLL